VPAIVDANTPKEVDVAIPDEVSIFFYFIKNKVDMYISYIFFFNKYLCMFYNKEQKDFYKSRVDLKN